MITFESSGSFSNTESFLGRMSKQNITSVLNSAGHEGVKALSSATPKDSGLASESWYFEVSQTKSGCKVTWLNHDIENGFPVAVMLQYGYGTGSGGYVQGKDYINPAIKPIFDRISDKVWKAVTSA
jgi:hypothetical protein